MNFSISSVLYIINGEYISVNPELIVWLMALAIMFVIYTKFGPIIGASFQNWQIDIENTLKENIEIMVKNKQKHLNRLASATEAWVCLSEISLAAEARKYELHGYIWNNVCQMGKPLYKDNINITKN